MEIDYVPIDGVTLRLKKVYNSILLETAEGNILAVCMRDSGFEIGVGDSIDKLDLTWYRVGNGCVEPMNYRTSGTAEKKESKLGQVVIPEPLASLDYVSDPKINAMLNDPNGGFRDKEKYPVPDDYTCPDIGSRWEIDREYHPSMGPRNAYTVLHITNLDHPSNKYPPQVVYQGDNGHVWSRGLSVWPGGLRRVPCSVILKDGCDPEFMASLARGDHLRGIGLSEEQIAKVQAISRKFPFKGSAPADRLDLGSCVEMVNVSQYQHDGFTECGDVAEVLVDGKPYCQFHAYKQRKN